MFTLKWIPKPHMEFVLANEVLNLCDLLVQLRHPCPLHPGNYVLLYSAAIPNAVPKVIITIYSAPALILHSNCRGSIKLR